MGEHLQLALGGHDGPWYLETPNHLPQEYHNFFGVELPGATLGMHAMVSPRSETSETKGPGGVNRGLDDIELDGNTSQSMMSGSEKDCPTSQIVLEQNLGVMVSPRSESESNPGPPTRPSCREINPPEIDLDNTSQSLISGVGSDKEGPSTSCTGAQVVLE